MRMLSHFVFSYMKALSKSESVFLCLLKDGLWNTSSGSYPSMTTEEWEDIYAIAHKQTVLGNIYDGISLLPKEKLPVKQIIFKFYTETLQIESLNKNLNKAVIDVVTKYKNGGLNPVLLKGQGLGQYYHEPLHRQSGDIDLYFHDEFDKANRIAATWKNVSFHPDTTYHRSFDYNGVEIENHLVYVDFYNSTNLKAWNQITKQVPLVGKDKFILGDFEVNVPSAQMNAIYVFLHIMHHFLQVGVGMRQVCDWVCLWKSKHEDIDKDLFIDCVDKLRIRRSMTALTYICETYLGLPCGYVPLNATTHQAKDDGEIMLRDIFKMGNFGHESGITDGFIRNSHLNNLKIYWNAFCRLMSLYRFYPSEVCSYPLKWIKSKLS